MNEQIKTPAEASESNASIIPKINTDVKHLEELRIAAHEYVLNGHPIVPMGCNQEAQDYKKPLIKWKDEGPLQTEAEVNRAFDQLRNRIFGIATIVKGYTLVDFDTEDTPKIFNGLEPTPTIKTGKGFHMWYGADAVLKQNGPIDLTDFEKRDGKKYQMEVYTENRLEVLPPSMHHSGVIYEWNISYKDFPELPKLPESIAKLCGKQKKDGNEYLTETVSEGGRNPVVFKVAGYFARRFHGDKVKIEQFTNDWNAQYCSPPLPEEEVNDMVDRISDTYRESDKEKKQTKGKKVQELLESDTSLTLFHDQNRVGYARILIKKRHVNVPIHSVEFMEHVRYKLYKETGEGISDQLLKETLSLLNAQALYEGEQYELNYRVAQDSDTIYYDLLNEDGEIVKISAEGWEVIPGSDAPFIFRLGSGKEQVYPIRGGNLKDLLNLVNIRNEDEQMLYLCTLPVRLIRDIDQAIMYIYGPAGSAKTTLLKMTKTLLDPSKGGISMPIGNVEDARVLLNQSWIFANDNISKIKEDLSNFFCIAATGAESSKRKLYTDSDLTVLTVKNPVYITGINVEAYKSDLLSRIFLLKTDTFSVDEKKNGKDIQNTFEELKPLLLGAIFDTLSRAINVKKTLTQKTAHRLADFSLWGAACAEVLGYGFDRFERAVKISMKQGAYDAIYSFSAGRALLEMLEGDGRFEGTTTELLNKLKKTDTSFDWHEPIANNPNTLGKKLHELSSSFLEIGISIDFRRSSNERRIVINKIGE